MSETAEETDIEETPWNRKMANGLRELADWFEETDLPEPAFGGKLYFHYFSTTEGAERIPQLLASECKISIHDDQEVRFTKQCGEMMARFDISRDVVCTKEPVETIALKPGTTATVNNNQIVIEKWNCPEAVRDKIIASMQK